MSLWSIPFTVPFLPALVRGLDEMFGEQLEETLILLPSRRAVLALREAMRPADGSTRLCPRIQPIGEVEEDALLLDPVSALDVPPAIDPIRRRLLLARLVRAVETASGGAPNVDRSMRLAGDLARFLDEMQTEEVGTSRLDQLVPAELAEHWQRTLAFLKIVDTTWPAVLADEDRVDPAQRRRMLLDARAETWIMQPPSHPVVIAGVTGSIPAVARLMKVVKSLPNGHLVLQGFDADASGTWSSTHPLSPLNVLLQRIDAAPEDVRLWHGAGRPSPRERLARRIGEVLPAGSEEIPAAAVQGLSVEVWREPASAAVSAALHLRETMEVPDRTAALVTTDRNFARRVAIELSRYGITVDDSAGTPLDQTPPGSLLLLVAHAAVDGFPPAGLLALLKHPLVRGHQDQGTFRRMVRALERGVLRGPRPAGGLDGILSMLRAAEKPRWAAPVAPEELATWFRAFAAAAAPLVALLHGKDAVRPSDILQHHLDLVRWLSTDEEGIDADFFAREAGAEMASFLPRLRQALVDEGPIPPSAWPALLAVLMADIPVRPKRPRHPRIAIRGRFEARLLHADRIVVAGLDEGAWPEDSDTGPWLNRSMRQTLGLPPIDAKIGAAGHDLLGQFAADELVLMRSRRDPEGGPTTPSRFLVRLEAALHGAGLLRDVLAGDGRAALIERLDAGHPARRRIERPRPQPRRSARPTEIWATEVETLLDDPYLFYARKILNLRELEPVDAQAGAAERGTAVHDAMEAFVRAHPDLLPTSPLHALTDHGRAAFARLAHYPQVTALWWPRFLRAAEQVVQAELARRCDGIHVLAERSGVWEIVLEGRRIALKAKADRLERRPDGQVVIVDYKTGNIPSEKDVAELRRPQILIEGLIARNGRFGSLANSEVAELALWCLSGRGSFHTTLNEALSEHLDRLEEGIVRLLAWYDDPRHAYAAVAKTEVARRQDGYDHLSRVAEWTAEAERLAEPESLL
ncbi:MAG TPA: double-strand break repair protein AddB [Geminicoccus sp.]|jgi:ATP-dependent helicase/nuclease subunit B|uniref:double-strand break repair protein AddB n=1 Tax=Geminicoccus sp. TaxID=2024832 RepID=UPI002E325BF0|nr:double-strand break repair protein AddB [Geminicoccus sp.]HEX2525256.1 double-strand break repair protein AddB [Geminicoccus sp.]